MCGLVGAMGVEKERYVDYATSGWGVGGYNKICLPDLGYYVRDLLLVDTLRGWDGTGIAIMGQGKMLPMVIKKPIHGADFISMFMRRDQMWDWKAWAIMGHNRAGTIGGNALHNTHPFHSGPVIMAHNGTLRSTTYLPRNKYGDTDSEQIAIALAQADTSDALKVIEGLHGAYALSWYDRRDRTMNFARNKERPLWFGYSHVDGVVAWASEKGMLALIDDRYALDFRYYELPVGKMLSISENFIPAEKKSLPLWEGVYSFNFSPYEIIPTTYMTTGKEDRKPKEKKEHIAPDWLKDHCHLDIGDTLKWSPQGWIEYKHKNGKEGDIKHGTITGRKIFDGLLAPVQVSYFGAKKNIWDNVQGTIQHSRIASAWISKVNDTDVYNIRVDTFDTPDDLMLKVAYHWEHEASADLSTKLGNFRWAEDENDKARFPGPETTMLTRAELKKLTEDGCALCGFDLLQCFDADEDSMAFAELFQLGWVQNYDPVCGDCCRQVEDGTDWEYDEEDFLSS